MWVGDVGYVGYVGDVLPGMPNMHGLCFIGLDLLGNTGGLPLPAHPQS